MPRQVKWSQRMALWQSNHQMVAAVLATPQRNLLWWPSASRRGVPNGDLHAATSLIAATSPLRVVLPRPALEPVRRSGLLVRESEGCAPCRSDAELNEFEGLRARVSATPTGPELVPRARFVAHLPAPPPSACATRRVGGAAKFAPDACVVTPH
jgi:hypothetical protein